MRFRVTVQYEYEVTHEGMANYPDQDPSAMAVLDQLVLAGDPEAIAQDITEFPIKVSVSPI